MTGSSPSFISLYVITGVTILLFLSACQTAVAPEPSGGGRTVSADPERSPEDAAETVGPAEQEIPEDGQEAVAAIVPPTPAERKEPELPEEPETAEEPELPEKPETPEEPRPPADERRAVSPSWRPPTEVATSVPNRTTALRVSRWVDSRPTAIRFNTDDGDDPIRRHIILGLLEAGGVVYDGVIGVPADGDSADQMSAGGAPTGETAAFGNRLVIVISDRFQESPGPGTYYATAELEAGIYIAGWDEELHHVAVSGPSVFSSLSYGDAALNSLYRVNPRSLQRVVFELRRRAADEIGSTGLTYRIYFDRNGDATVQYAVMRSIGIPGESDNLWYIHRSPGDAEQRIMDALKGGPYRFDMDHEARLGYFTMEEVQ